MEIRNFLKSCALNQFAFHFQPFPRKPWSLGSFPCKFPPLWQALMEKSCKSPRLQNSHFDRFTVPILLNLLNNCKNTTRKSFFSLCLCVWRRFSSSMLNADDDDAMRWCGCAMIGVKKKNRNKKSTQNRQKMGHVWSAFGKNGKQKKNTRNDSRAGVCQRCTDKDGKCCLHSTRSWINILWPWQWTPRSVLPVSARVVNAEAKKNRVGKIIFEITDFHCQGEVASLTTGLVWTCLLSVGSSWNKPQSFVLCKVSEIHRFSEITDSRTWFASETLHCDTLIDNTSLPMPALRL